MNGYKVSIANDGGPVSVGLLRDLFYETKEIVDDVFLDSLFIENLAYLLIFYLMQTVYPFLIRS